MDVRTIVFVHIKRLTSSESLLGSSGLSARVSSAVQTQIDNLAERQEYVSRSDGQPDQHIDLLEEYGAERAKEISAYYKRFRQLPLEISNREIEYSDLRPTLAQIAQRGPDAVIDITAVKKRYLGDIVAGGLVEGVTGLWTFDLQLEKSNFAEPWRM